MAVKRRSVPGKPRGVRSAAQRPRESEARFELAMRAINEGVYDWDIARGTVHYSEGVYSVLKMPRSMKTVGDWRRRIHSEDLPAFTAAISAHLKGDTKRFECDYRFRAADGGWRWARQHGIAQRDGRGRAIRMIGSTGDITELKRIEQALKESEQRYELATRAATEGIYDWNIGTGELYLSEQAKAFFGVRRGRLTPKAWNERIHPEDYSGYRKAVVACLKGLSPQLEQEYRVRNAAGEFRWFLDRGVAVRDEAGRATRLVGAMSDITQRKLHEIELRRARDETAEALERQTATAEILKVISSSPTDVQPVFDAIVATAVRLLACDIAVVQICSGDTYSPRAMATPAGLTPVLGSTVMPGSTAIPVNPDANFPSRAIVGKTMLHVPDWTAVELPPHEQRRHEQLGLNCALYLPLLRGDNCVGVLVLGNKRANAFDDKAIALAESFRDQAVIAIENVRLFNETREALERQTATADILRVIASSPSDIQPVFDAIVESGVRLCNAGFGIVFRFDGEQISLAAGYNLSDQEWEGLRRIWPMRPAPGSLISRAVLERRVIEVLDYQVEVTKYAPLLPSIRSILAAPMLRGGEPIGVLAIFKREVAPFTPHQTELLQAFAVQAVIAIENVRLFNETREALERQTAIGDILRVISSSLADVKPVLEAVAAHGARICEAQTVDIALVEGGSARIVASVGDAGRVIGQQLALDRSSVTGRCITDRLPVHVMDMQAAAEEFPVGSALSQKYGFRTMLGVPLLRDGQALGAINARRAEVRPFDDKHIALLKTFADQAAIAIENVRLFNETREALERQTATAEILKVISSSPTDTQPVFDAIVQSTVRLFHAARVRLFLVEGDDAKLRARHGPGTFDGDDQNVVSLPLHGSVVGQAILSAQAVQFADFEAPGVPAAIVARNRAFGIRSTSVVPLLRDGKAIGAITVPRSEPGVLSEKQMALLTTFADQAVIAIENVRLFNETREALERQTATAEILRVIAESPADVQPVFDALVQKAVQLCGAQTGMIFRREGDMMRLDAAYGAREGFVEYVRQHGVPLDRRTVTGRTVVEGHTVHILDVQNDPEYSYGGQAIESYRSMLGVPLVREGEPIGTFSLWRHHVEAFTPRQIALIEIFAAQAVIAIENVRLFNETKEALERQTATAEILRVISSSPTDTQPVFEAIVQSAGRLFAPCDATITMLEQGVLNWRATAAANITRTRIDQVKTVYPLPFDPERSLSCRAISERRTIEITDAAAPATPEAVRMAAQAGDFRSAVFVPLIREDEGIGSIVLTHPQAGFKLDEKQLALLRTFADQAVIAIENVRLFKELQQRTEALTRSVGQLTALGEVGQAISSTLDLETVLKTIVSRAVQLTGMAGGTIYEFDEPGGVFHLRAAENMPDELAEVYRRMPIRLGEGIVGGAAAKREPMQVADIRDPGYQTRYRELLLRQGYRAILAVPLLRDEQIIGALTVSRNEPGAFAPEVVELLKTFATQSALAIQNARLFREIADKGKQLEVASHHKSQFLASMSHELRTPLNAILGFNEMILGDVYGEVSADMRPPLAQMQTSGKHLLRLINNVLDLAKIEAGRMELALSDYSVQDTVASVTSTLQPLAAEKGLEFLATVPADIPLAYGDGGRITQCLMNLAGNSLKFTRQGKVEIAVEQKDGLLTYKVSDTGIGIPPDKIGNLFTEFKQTDATIASEYGGTGLGLSISKKFIEMHGGRIWVESEPGKGSSFIFELPLRVAGGAA